MEKENSNHTEKKKVKSEKKKVKIESIRENTTNVKIW